MKDNIVIKKFKTIPKTVEAVIYHNNAFTRPALIKLFDGKLLTKYYDQLAVETSTGTEYANIGDYIVKSNSSFSVCKPELFVKTYKEVTE